MLPRRSSPEIERLERLATPHGEVVLLELEDGAALEAALAALPEAERAHAARLGDARRRGFVAGRAALHAALGDREAPIVADDRGAPVLPAGWVGSISHKGAVAAALVAPAGAGWVGVDLERAAPPRADIGRRVLTPREREAIAHLGEGEAHGRAVTLRFAIKEAIYKAVDPHVRRYVAFTEVELDVGAAGEPCGLVHALPLVIEAAWREHAGHWLATARARPR